MALPSGVQSRLYFLGMGKNRTTIISSICLVVITFFYLTLIGSAFHTHTYTFQHRVTYDTIFQTHLTTLNIDIIILLSASIIWIYLTVKGGYKKVSTIFFSVFIVLHILNYVTISTVGALITFPIICYLIIIDRHKNQILPKHDTRLYICYLVIATIILASLGIISLVLFIMLGINPVTLERYAYTIYQQLLSILSPVIMAALIFCVPLKIVLNRLNIVKVITSFDIAEDKMSNNGLIILLSSSVILGIVVAFVPHIQNTNPNNERLGVDSLFYEQWLELMQNQTGNTLNLAFKQISNGDRPLTLLILFFITEVTKTNSFQVLEFSPLLLNPLLALVTFLLTRQLTANDKISIIASLLSTISFQTLIGIYSGFYANWLGLILGYFAFTLVVKYLKSLNKLILVILALTITGVLFAHLYTWSIVISVAFLFLFTLNLLHCYPKKHLLVLFLVISSSIVVDLVKSSLIDSTTGLEADFSLGVKLGFGISQFGERITTLGETVQTYYGGAFANIAILGLVMYWLVRCKARQLANIFVLIFLSSALIPLFLGDWVLQSRVMYDIPFQIPAAISLFALWKGNHNLLFIGILLITGYLSFHVLANLGYVPPADSFIVSR